MVMVVEAGIAFTYTGDTGYDERSSFPNHPNSEPMYKENFIYVRNI